MEALLDLYAKTGGGVTWVRNCVHESEQEGCWGSLSTNTSFCEWYGITCSPPINDDPSTRVVTGLDLANNELLGILPSTILSLHNLTSLQLQGNALQVTTPPPHLRRVKIN